MVAPGTQRLPQHGHSAGTSDAANAQRAASDALVDRPSLSL